MSEKIKRVEISYNEVEKRIEILMFSEIEGRLAGTYLSDSVVQDNKYMVRFLQKLSQALLEGV